MILLSVQLADVMVQKPGIITSYFVMNVSLALALAECVNIVGDVNSRRIPRRYLKL